MPKRTADTAHQTDMVQILLDKYPDGVHKWIVAIRTHDVKANVTDEELEYLDIAILMQYKDSPMQGLTDKFLDISSEVDHVVVSPGVWVTTWDISQVMTVDQAAIRAMRIAEDCDSTMFYTMFMKCNRALGSVFFAADYFACSKTLDHVRMVFCRRFMGSNAPYKRPIVQMFMQTKSNEEIIDDVVNYIRVKMGSKKNPLERLNLFHIRGQRLIPHFIVDNIRSGLPDARWKALIQTPNVFIALGLP
tara:strand:+ start:647 stop:1387 length:741 start_codon:yes stop_codon:yes gene_type:complete